MFNILKKHIYLIPPIQMFILVVLAIFEYSFNYKFPLTFLFNLGATFGNSTSTLLIYLFLFLNPKSKYCLFTKSMVLALFLNQILYYFSFYISNNLYQNIYTIFSFMCGIIGYFLILKTKK